MLQGNNKVAFNCDHHTFNYLVDGGYSEPWPTLMLHNECCSCVPVTVFLTRPLPALVLVEQIASPA